MMEFVSWDDEIPNMMGKSFKIPWFQSPPTSILSSEFIPYIQWVYPLYESRFYTMEWNHQKTN